MKTENLTSDELLAGTYIATKLIRENHPGITEAAIDAAISRAYVVSATAEQWEAATRMLLALKEIDELDESERLVPRDAAPIPRA